MSTAWARHSLLTPREMSQADRLAADGGMPGVQLMEEAGAAVAHAIMSRWPVGPVVVLCGPGNNGGDGFVAARHLKLAGWPVRLALSGPIEALRGDAAVHAQAWPGPVERLDPGVLDHASLVVDALFGAGLSRPLEGVALATVRRLRKLGLPVCAVDVPSGLDGETGMPRPDCVRADLTVTFFRKKPGHLLLPGRLLCGDLVCAQIGIPDKVLDEVAPACFENHPDLWRETYPWPRADGHKYRRGHALVVGGPDMPGAVRLASLGAARAGAGLVSLAVPPAVWAVQAGALTSVMVRALPETGDLAGLLADERLNALLIGPGMGRADGVRSQVLALLATRRATVLDADALSVFEDDPEALFGALHEGCVLTPHEGEFARLFPAVTGSKLQRAREAAHRTGAICLLKGADTVIAHPERQAAINCNAPPELATGGSGDVLAGLILGLLAQGMAPFDAACAAVYLHGLAARQVGPGLIAEDLPGAVPAALGALRKEFF